MSKTSSGAASRAAKALGSALLWVLAATPAQLSHAQQGAPPPPAPGAKVRVLSLVEKTRLAPLVVAGRVTAVGGGRLTLAARKTLKGSAASREIQVPWAGKPLGELQPPALKAGDEILAFLEGRAGILEPVAGPQGIVPLSPQALADASQAVADIVRLDSSRGPLAKARVLEQMLDSKGRASQAAALEVIYLEYHTRAFGTRTLVKPVLRLSASPDRSIALLAIQVLSRIADKAAVPPLIDKVGGVDPRVAAAAHRALRSLTGADVRLDRKGMQSPAGRKLAAERWRAWWNEHQARVVLRH